MRDLSVSTLINPASTSLFKNLIPVNSLSTFDDKFDFKMSCSVFEGTVKLLSLVV